jgi:prepilin-type N-terminal cleavage/methylation domain-containing protein
MTRKSGFTLIELLVVIAIISILAAIIFPVFAKAKESAYRSSDMTSLNSIRTALQLYRADQAAYPPQLLGYVSLYQTGPNAGQVIPANQYQGALYPRRLDSYKVLVPALNGNALVDTTNAVWPEPDGRPVGTAPILDLDHNGQIDGADDLSNARQAYGPTSGFYMSTSPYVTSNAGNAAQFYAVSGYETNQVKTPSGPVTELRYTLFWTGWGLLGGGNTSDDPRQLGYQDPAETTVVTWDSYFRDYDTAFNATHAKRDIVLFLGGSARAYDSADLASRSYRVMP